MATRSPTKNRLSQETSPYLLQHATNPVDWYPWGPEALTRAQQEDKPILLSVGYSACHWCHVMERESFENPGIARLMNNSFICIKVDREERPDIDDVYMAATIAISGSGGWPMTVFCTPDQVPFFAGTYFPPDDRQGRPGFPTLLTRIAELWAKDRDALFRQAGEVQDHISKLTMVSPPQTVSAASWELAAGQLARTFDEEWGGFGTAPKFPPSQALHLLLRQHHRSGNEQLLHMVTRTLDAMHAGGIYDHVGGGFARYSVDERWLVPHFEKMLYDNAQLPRVYLEAYLVTGSDKYRSVVTETLDYVIRDMQGNSGGYYSATDADSEGIEGKYFVFTPREVRAILEPEETRAFCAYYDISESGNWEGKSIPNTPRSPAEVARDLGLPLDDLLSLLQSSRAKVFDARKLRIAPHTDNKILTGWNGLMIGTMAEAGRVLGVRRYIDSALRAALYCLNNAIQPNGELYRTVRNGKPGISAVLEDYAYLVDGFIDLYEASGDPLWLTQARHLAEVMLAEFLDSSTGAFFQTAHSHESLIVRLRDGNDGALPNAGAVAARALIRLSHHFDDTRLQTVAIASIRAYGHAIERQPQAFLTTLNAAEWLLTGAVQLFFAGPFEETLELRNAAAKEFVPHRIIAYSTPVVGSLGSERTRDEQTPSSRRARSHHSVNNDPSPSPWAEKLPIDGTPCLYICRDYACERPVMNPGEVTTSLRSEAHNARHHRARTLSLPRVQGWATPEGTHRYFERQLLDPSATRKFGRKDPILVSRVGFGTYRVNESVPSHQEALLLALRQGCNLIDTAAVYANGASERAVGNTLAELLRTGEVQRDEIVLITKIGQSTEVPDKTKRGGSMFTCLNVDFLEQQLSGSLERLNVECVDVCLLHNPELLFGELPHAEALAQIATALSWLEQQVSAGRVRRYGVSSNDLGRNDVSPTLDELLRAARSSDANHFEVLQIPLNVVERQAATNGLLAKCEQYRLTALTHRPLNAMSAHGLTRLWDAPEAMAAPDFESARSAVGAMEHEFRANLGAVLRAVPDLKLAPDGLFTWSERINAEQIVSREVWNEFESGVLGRELPQVMNALHRATRDKQLGRVWQQWQTRYTAAMEQLVLAAQAAASRATNERNLPLREALLATTPEGVEQPTLSQMVVHRTSSEPGVTATLVGMRHPRYVSEVTATLRFPNWEEYDQELPPLG